MAHIEDIRVNGQQSSESVMPVIGGLLPVITWDYVTDAASEGQVYYEVQIGTSSTNWGTDLFSGGVVDVFAENTTNTYEYSLHNLSRGSSYYGQIRVTDENGDKTIWGKFAFQVNRLPFVTGYRLSPAFPNSANEIELDYTYNDADGHDQSGTKIRWFRNNLPVQSYDDLCTLPASATNPGESWTAKIIPSDGLEYGPVVETAAVTIESLEATFSDVSILPANPNVDDLLKVEYVLQENEYVSFMGTVDIEWYINDQKVSGTTGEIVRLSVSPGDVVYVLVKLTNAGSIIAQKRSANITISDVPWYVFNLQISGLSNPINVTDLSPILDWEIHKTTASRQDKPNYVRVLVTKTPSIEGPIYDTGVIQYVKKSHIIPNGVLKRGQKYFFHVAVSDLIDIDSEQYVSTEVRMAGSSWAENVSNSTGWTVEFKGGIELSDSEFLTPTHDHNIGLYIHDGTYFCSVLFGLRSVTLLSDTSVVYTYLASEPSLRVNDAGGGKTFKIVAKGQHVRIFMNNKMIIDGVGILTNRSNLKMIEYGDIDTKNSNTGIFRFFRYSTLGAFGLDDGLTNEDTFYFDSVGHISGGSIEFVFENLISWTPNDSAESGKLIQFNENAVVTRLPTVTTNYSPITAIYVDKNRDKFIGTANGVTAIYGEKHDPDYVFDTSASDVTITPNDFDRITTIPINKIPLAEPNTKQGFFTIDTTYRSIGETDTSFGFITGDPYDPYNFAIASHAIHYYSQRTHGHSWYDRVDNEKGWQISFTFDLAQLEADDFAEQNLDKSGFGVYVNDGTYQEIIYFYEDRIRLFYANVYVPIVTGTTRDYVIRGKGESLYIHQKLSNSATSNYRLLVDGSGLFTTPAVATGNSSKPKVDIDSQGVYHAVWHDDGTTRSQIMYASFDGQSWTTPVPIVETRLFNVRNPSITIDSVDRVWVAYEDTSWGSTEISVSVKDKAGWNPKTRVTNSPSHKGRPSIRSVSSNDIHLVWEDNRNGHWEIFWAQWSNARKAWLSSGQFGDDQSVMQFDSDDPYQSDAVDFRNPKLGLLGQKLWLVCEGHFPTNDTAIYRGYYDLGQSFWNASGSVVIDENGEFIGSGTATMLSSAVRKCFNPTIATSEKHQQFIVVWEDQTEPVGQIWGSAYSANGAEIESAIQITNGILDSKYPEAGFLLDNAVIAFSRANSIYATTYTPLSQEFFGSALGDSDVLIDSGDDRQVKHVAVPDYSPSLTTEILFDFKRDRSQSNIDVQEFPDYQLIGSSTIESVGISYNTTTNTMISSLDSKEFAFGDFSENVGMIANWKNIKLYYGYDARPPNIQVFNNNSVVGWDDNRVNDLFADAFGNIVAATFGGLYYYNTFTAQLTKIDGDSDDGSSKLLQNKLTTSVRWGGNGIWYVGTLDGVFTSRNAGRTWSKLLPNILTGRVVNDMAINKRGEAVVATVKLSLGNVSESVVYIVHPDFTDDQVQVISFASYGHPNIKSVAVDENDIVWVGSDDGLFRVENLTNFIKFNRSSGMRSSYVNDIAIVNKHLRYLATATGVERMNGMKFTNFNTKTHDLTNSNISRLQWVPETNSLWVASLHTLHEILFRDPVYDIIDDEVTVYDHSEISTEEHFDKDTFFVLDFDQQSAGGVALTSESAAVYLNMNKLDFGFSVNESGQSILFDTDLLASDQVEVAISNRFIEFHDFNQSSVERSVIGDKRTEIKKMDRTSTGNQLLVLSGGDKHGISLYSGEANLPYTTIVLDTKPPEGCLELLDTLTRTKMRFRILASDDLSGLDGYILSNYPNFTEDGETPLDFQPITTVVDHDLGEGINNVFDSLTFPDTITVNAETFTVGNGAALESWVDESANNTEVLFAGTSAPMTIFKYNKADDTWLGIAAVDASDQNRVINDMKTINNVVYITTGTSTSGGVGHVYKIADGVTVSKIGSVTGTHARGIAGGADGTVYIGSSDGKIYQYRSSVWDEKYENIGASVYALDILESTMIVGTGNSGRAYTINLDTGENLIVFDSSDSHVSVVHIKDSLTGVSRDQANLYLGSGNDTVIYRADLENFVFVKSYSSFGKTIKRIKTVEDTVLDQDATTSTSSVPATKVVAAIGTDLFKHVVPSWEFVYQHPETIRDFIQYESGGVEGLWVISDTRVTKWTAVLSEKTVYLQLRDKAGNVSTVASSGTCPDTESTPPKTCCSSYSIKIEDLKDFINEGRIIDVDEYGAIVFTYDSTNNRQFFSADQIDQEVGTYTSETFNGSNDLVSWKSVTWSGIEPSGTAINLQIRSGVTEDAVIDAEWSSNLVKNATGIVSIEHISDQYIQFRAILTSTVRDSSPSLSSVTLQNITAQASHFFTTNFVLPSRPIKGLLTANTFIPVSSDIVFGINTKNSVDFGDYQIIEPNRLFTLSQGQFGENLRIGAKLLSPGIPQLQPTSNPGDPYDESSYVCNITFEYENIDSTNDFHFRTRFYNDPFRTQLVYTFFSGNDQTGWTTTSENIFPATGVTINNGSTSTITFSPLDAIETNQRWYIVVDAWNGSNFETIIDNRSYICSSCNVVNESGLVAEYYKTGLGGYTLDAIPSFSGITPDHVYVESRINFAVTSSEWVTTDPSAPIGGVLSGYDDNFAIRFKGKILIPAEGTYSFTLESNDGSMLFIDGTQIIDHDGVHALTEKTGSTTLTTGFHDIEVHYFESEDDAGLILKWAIPGESQAVVPASSLFHAVANEYCSDLQTPRIFNLAAEFELENGETVKINQLLT